MSGLGLCSGILRNLSVHVITIKQTSHERYCPGRVFMLLVSYGSHPYRIVCEKA